jgi:hypothetical protein
VIELKEEKQRVGEVIQATTTGFTAQCYKLYELPPLGSLVKTRNDGLEIYGIVHNAATTSIESGRHPIARGKDEANQEAVYKSSPQLEKLLRSEFEVLVVGYKDEDKIRQYLPPDPAHIHSFVYLCQDEEVKEFSQSLSFMNILLNVTLPLPQEELIAACLRQMSLVQADGHAFLVDAGKHLAILLSGDYNRLKAVLERIKR